VRPTGTQQAVDSIPSKMGLNLQPMLAAIGKQKNKQSKN